MLHIYSLIVIAKDFDSVCTLTRGLVNNWRIKKNLLNILFFFFQMNRSFVVLSVITLGTTVLELIMPALFARQLTAQAKKIQMLLYEKLMICEGAFSLQSTTLSYGSECWPAKTLNEKRLHVAERMLR